MSHFTPGKIIHTFFTDKGQEAVIRYPMLEDLDTMLLFINELSQEDTFITYSGETISKEGEIQFLSDMITRMEQNNGIFLVCFINGKMIGSVSILRDMQGRKRSFHVGIFGITVLSGYRGEGIGEALARMALEEAKKHIGGLQIITLDVYSLNSTAQNLYKKLGFVEFGRLPKGILYKNEYVDKVQMYLPSY